MCGGSRTHGFSGSMHYSTAESNEMRMLFAMCEGQCATPPQVKQMPPPACTHAPHIPLPRRVRVHHAPHRDPDDHARAQGSSTAGELSGETSPMDVPVEPPTPDVRKPRPPACTPHHDIASWVRTRSYARIHTHTHMHACAHVAFDVLHAWRHISTESMRTPTRTHIYIYIYIYVCV
jgi:hypothetical protein